MKNESNIKTKSGAVVTRIAPSPTGVLHVGTARTALFNYLFARKHGGTFIVRSEDTDKERSTRKYEENILEGLAWLGLKHDEFIRQSERVERHQELLKQLIESEHAYLSKEDSKVKPGTTVEVVRLKNEGKDVTFNDMIRGEITFNTSELGDFVIARSIHEPLYHFAVVVDDADRGVTHVIRGEDHISNTPRQILIREALGFERPHYAHIPLILAPDRSKLSKRKGGASIIEFQEKGYLPEALVNYLVLLGWNPGGEEEVFSLSELEELFDIEKIQHGGAVFDIEKLKWLNAEYLKKLSRDVLLKEIIERIPEETKKLPDYTESRLTSVVPLIAERIKVFDEVSTLAKEGELDYYFSKPQYEAKNLLWKDDTDREVPRNHLKTVIEILETLLETSFTEKSIKDALWDYASKEGRGSVLWPMRYALSGKEKSPDPFLLGETFGKKETLERLDTALNALSHEVEKT